MTARTARRESLDSAHLSEGVCAVPSRSWMLTPLVKVRNLVPITQVANGWVMSSGLAVTDIKTGSVIQMPLDEANEFFADPSAVVADPAGRRAFVASGGGDVVTVVDLERLAGWLEKADPATRREAIYDLSLSPEYVIARIPTGRNPQHLALSPDGGTLFVAERLADSILVVDAKSLPFKAGLCWATADGMTRFGAARGFLRRRLTPSRISFPAAPAIPTVMWTA